MTQDSGPHEGTTKRAAMAGVGLAGLTAALTACGAEKVVVTQPSAGKYKAFSAVCTHQQCLVDRVANGTIDCPCHGSEFSVKNGTVVSGPAPSPLPGKLITVAGGKITLA